LVKTGQVKIEDEIRRRKWRWIGHTLRKPQGTITSTGSVLEPAGYEKNRNTKENMEKRVEM
jgi:hypothetical protein